MRDRRPSRHNFTFVLTTSVAIALFGAARAARAADPAGDPFAEKPPAVPQSNVA